MSASTTEIRPAARADIGRSPARILMLSTALGVGGGAEEQVALLSLGLRRRGWEVRIVSLLPLFPISEELAASDIQLSSLGMRKGVPDPRAMLRLIRDLRAFRPDVVHAHMPQANLLARAVRPLCPFPALISTLHNVTMERINGGSGRWLERAHGWTEPCSDLTTVICRAAAESYVERRAALPHKLAVLHNGVNVATFAPDGHIRRRVRCELGLEETFAWLAIGRFELAKDYPNMIRAFSKVTSRTTRKLALLICGQGSLEEKIRAEVRTCGLDKTVVFLGVRRDIADIMKAADAFTMSSYMEGLPMALLQAAATGLPIVTTDTGGNSEVVLDGVNGLVVKPRDDDALANAMERILRISQDERAAMAERGRFHVREHFEMERIVDRWENLYFELLRQKAKERNAEK